METLTPEHRRAVANLRSFVENLENPPASSRVRQDKAFTSDHFLLRFLRARQFNEANAMTLLQGHLTWLDEKRILEAAEEPFEEKAILKRYYPHCYHGVDKKGRPLYIERLGKLEMPRLLAQCKPERVVDYFARESEIQVRKRMPACCLARGEVVDRSLNIVDLEGMSFGMATHSIARKVMKEVVRVQQDHYPEVMGQSIVVNAPPVFKLAWNFVRPLLDEKTVSKITIYSYSYQDALKELVDEKSLPKFLGGQCECDVEGGCMMNEIGPWVDPDIVEYMAAHPDIHWEAYTPEGAKRFHGMTEAEQATKDVSPAASETSEKSELVAQPLSDEEAEARQQLDHLQEEYQAREEKLMGLLTAWVKLSRDLVTQIGRPAIERAQDFYDAITVKHAAQSEYNVYMMQYQELSETWQAASDLLSKCEDSFQAYCMKEPELLTEDEWSAITIEEEPAEMVREDRKLYRAWVVTCLTDRVTKLLRRRERIVVELKRLTAESAVAQKKVDVENNKHTMCTWNCSVHRAALFYEKRREHEIAVEAQMNELKVLEEKLQEARQNLDAVTPFNKRHRGKAVCIKGFTMDDDGFYSCSEGEEDENT